MKNVKNVKNVVNHIINELTAYCKNAEKKGFVIGVSGGIDSAVVSKLCAMTGLPTLGCLIKINDKMSNSDVLAWNHLKHLQANFSKVYLLKKYLTNTLITLKDDLPLINKTKNSSADILLVNTISRLRMLALYAYAGNDNLLVVGTGNKVEDFGVGFFTKYGDGGVDISPIADLLKSEVYEIGKFLDIHEDIINAKPTDGLWEDGRTDEDQIGATYEELEWAMRFIENNRYYSHEDIKNFTDRRIKVLHIFNTLHQKNKHKIISIPIIKISKKLKGYDEKISR